MKLLGERNWYLPRWLAWLPEVHLEAPAPAAAVAVPTAPPKEERVRVAA
jgi:RND superfamily putative drug exporter